MRHYFKGRYFDLHKDDVILNTIQVYEIRDGELQLNNFQLDKRIK